jgi:hypothetical protein
MADPTSRQRGGPISTTVINIWSWDPNWARHQDGLTVGRNETVKVNRRLGGKYRLHFWGRRICRARNLPSSACHLLSRWFLARLAFRLWSWRSYFPQKRRLTFNGLQGVTSQKTVLFKTEINEMLNKARGT